MATGQTPGTARRGQGPRLALVWPLILALGQSSYAATPRSGPGDGRSDASSAAAVADSGPPRTFQGTVDVVEVLVEVAVTDKRGTPILGLGVADFLVEEDGLPVEVVHVEPLSGRASTGSVTMAAPFEERVDLPRLEGTASPARSFILLLQHLLFESDTTTLGATSRKFAAVRELRRWVAQGLAPGDCVAVFAYDSRLRPLLDFSDDRQELDLAIRRALMDRSGPVGWRAPSSSCPQLLPHLPAGNELRDRTRTITEGLASLAEAAGRVDGRKHLLLFSLGIGLREARRDGPGIGAALSLSQTLNGSRVTAYTLDLTPPRVRHTQEAALQGLARRTGGKYFGRSVGFLVPLQRIGALLEGSYRIAFRSRYAAGSVGYRSIEVRTAEPSLLVSSQRGYVVREPGADGR